MRRCDQRRIRLRLSCACRPQNGVCGHRDDGLSFANGGVAHSVPPLYEFQYSVWSGTHNLAYVVGCTLFYHGADVPEGSGQLTSARSDPLFVNKRIMPALFREAEHAKFHSIDSQRTTIPTPNQQLAQHSLAYGNPRNSRLDTTVGSARLPPPSPALKCAVNCIRSPTYKEVNVIKCEIDGCTNVTGFTRESDLGRHKRSVHCEGPLYECPTAGCYHRTHRKDKMKSHRKNKHDGEDIGLYREKS